MTLREQGVHGIGPFASLSHDRGKTGSPGQAGSFTVPNNLPVYIAEIDALVLPYSGQNNGKDCAGEEFTAETDFMEEALPNPPIIYAHGYPLGDNPDAAQSVVVGRTLGRWRDPAGGWAKIGLYQTVFTKEILDAQKAGTLGFSSTALLKKLDPSDKTKIKVWMAGEFSVLTDKTGVPPCNLLAKPLEMNKAELAQIVASQPDELRQHLLAVMELPDDYLADTIVTEENHPVNPEATAAMDGEINFSIEGDLDPVTNGETEMTPEEIAAAIATGIAPLQQKLDAMEAETKKKCGCADPPDNMQKSNIAEYLREKSAEVTGDTDVQTSATQLIDSYITAGRLDPLKRLPAISGLVIAINADGRRKMAGGAVDNFLALLAPSAGSSFLNPDLKKFDFKAVPAMNASVIPKPEDVDAMYAAAVE